MAKAEWGLKRICPHCNTRYYDMKKNPPVCPNCGGLFDPEALLRSRRGRITETRKNTPLPEDTVDDLPISGAGEPDDTVIEDADELADDDMEEVIEVEEDSDERDRHS